MKNLGKIFAQFVIMTIVTLAVTSNLGAVEFTLPIAAGATLASFVLPKAEFSGLRSDLSPYMLEGIDTASRVSALASMNPTSRNLFFERMQKFIPSDIREALQKNTLQVIEKEYFWRVTGAGLSQVDFITDAQVKSLGVTNVNNGKLPVREWFLLSEIRIRAGVNAVLADTAFAPVTGRVESGQIDIKVDTTTIMNEIPLSMFTHNNNGVVDGYVKLDNPKFIEPQKKIEAIAKFASALAANTNLELVFRGAAIAKL